MTSEIVLISFQVVILVMSVVVHEVAHGLAALRLGDPTAKYAGRLTLNPLKHLDWMGSFLVPLILIKFFGMAFGWAKPVPYNPYNLRDQKIGPALVGLAGPLSNILLALAFGLAARFIDITTLMKVDIKNIFLRGDYSDLTFAISGSLGAVFFLICAMVVTINVFLAFFNLIPIPPLDGSKLLLSILPVSTETKIMLEQYGFVFLMVVIFLLGGLLGYFLSFALNAFFFLVVGV